MSLPAFIKDNNQQTEKKPNKKKGNFNERCLEILKKIKKLDREKYDELSRTFQSQYCGHNVQKKRIIGFYGQLVHEFKLLEDREKKGPPPPKAPVKTELRPAKKEKKTVKTKAKKVKSKAKKVIKKTVKKKVKKKLEKKSKKTTKKKKKR